MKILSWLPHIQINAARNKAGRIFTGALIKCLSVSAILILILINAASVRAAQTLLWSDEFDGTTVDTTKWQVMDVADGTDSWFRPANVTVSNGTLKINSKEELYY